MDKPKIVVQVYPEYWDRPIRVDYNMDHSMFEDTFRRIDEPPANASTLDRMMCTPEDVIVHVKRLREDAARLLANALTKAIMRAMESRDLRSGYAKDGAP